MSYELLKSNIAALMQKEMKRLRVPGASLALVDGQETVWAAGFGFADRPGRGAATARTVFMIGSITKLFTATAIMQQVELGQLDLDRPVQDYVPEFSIKSRFPDAQPITVRHLMTHHSGIPCDNLRRMWTKSIDEQPESFHAVLDFLHSQYVASPPGRIFAYSNQAVSLLGVVLERVSEEPYAGYIQAHVLHPLGMESATLLPDDRVRPLLSKGYSKAAGEWEGRIRDIPAGGIYACANDMSRFIAMVNGQGSLGLNQILRPETLAEMFRPQNEGMPLDFGFKIGLNWMLSLPSLEEAGKVGWHDGGTRNFTSNLIVLPEQRLGVVILTNSPSGGILTHRIAEEALQLALREGRGIDLGQKETIQPARHATGKEGVADLDDFVGEYPSFTLGMITLRPGGRLNLRGFPLKLVAEAGGWYSLLLGLGPLTVRLKLLGKIRVAFRKIEARKVFAVDQEGFRMAVAEQAPRHSIPQAWIRRIGRYVNLEEDNPSIQQGMLKYARGLLYFESTVRRMGRIRIFLQPVNDEEAITAGLGRFAGETVTVREINEEPHLEVNGCLFKRRQ